MKKILLISVLLIGLKAGAQDFTGQRTGYIHFYHETLNGNINRVPCDSADVSGSDSLYWFRPGLRSSFDSSDCEFWGGPICYLQRDKPSSMGRRAKAGNRYIQYYNYLNDSITFDLHLNVGDSALVYEDSLQRVRIKLQAASPTTTFGVTDSMLVFTFQHYDLMDNVITSSLNGSPLSFSKNFGLFTGYCMDSFPHILQPVMLEGVRGPNVGFHGISMASAYDFSVGAVYETHTYASGPPNSNYHRYTILSRTDFTDRIEYSVKEEHQVLNYMVPPPYPYVFSEDTIMHVRYKNVWVDQMLPYGVKLIDRYYHGTGLLDCSSFPGIYYEVKINQCMTECPGTTCIGWGDCFMSSEYNYKYAAGVGLIESQTQSITSFSTYFTEDLIYIDNGTFECGEMALGINNVLPGADEVKLYPNPAGRSVTLETGSLQGTVINIHVADVTGKKQQAVITASGRNLTIDLSAIAPGTYWVAIETTGGILSKKLVIVR